MAPPLAQEGGVICWVTKVQVHYNCLPSMVSLLCLCSLIRVLDLSLCPEGCVWPWGRICQVRTWHNSCKECDKCQVQCELTITDHGGAGLHWRWVGALETILICQFDILLTHHYRTTFWPGTRARPFTKKKGSERAWLEARYPACINFVILDCVILAAMFPFLLSNLMKACSSIRWYCTQNGLAVLLKHVWSFLQYDMHHVMLIYISPAAQSTLLVKFGGKDHVTWPGQGLGLELGEFWKSCSCGRPQCSLQPCTTIDLFSIRTLAATKLYIPPRALLFAAVMLF